MLEAQPADDRLRLGAAQRVLDRRNGTPHAGELERDARAAEPLAKGIDSLAQSIAEVRRISRDLRPSILDDLGLGPALKTLVEQFALRTGIQCRFDTVVFRNRLDDEAKIALYRIAQEALTNIERHARATEVIVDLRGHRQGATLSISDNGLGLAKARSTSGIVTDRTSADVAQKRA